MKLEELKQIIRTEVKAAIREELKEILVEAVEIASRPENNVKGEEKTSIEKIARPVLSSRGPRPSVPKVGIEAILESTRKSMTGEDLTALVGEGSRVNTGAAVSVAHQMGFTEEGGLDLSKLGFVKKAKTVLELAEQKDRERGA